MCTVTFIPYSQSDNSFVLTDNRDESVNRSACSPAVYKEYDTQLYYPRDKKAGGTWFGVSHRNHVMTLMNGAFGPHKRKKEYRESRGVVVKQLIAKKALKKAFMEYDLEGIEAFFGVVVSWRERLHLYELIWDGENRFLREKDASKPAIWSSAMLYSKKETNRKERRFRDFLEADPHPNKKAVWQFHHDRGNKQEIGLVIDRGRLQTTSIAQFSLRDKDLPSFCYEDLISGHKQEESIKWNPAL